MAISYVFWSIITVSNTIHAACCQVNLHVRDAGAGRGSLPMLRKSLNIRLHFKSIQSGFSADGAEYRDEPKSNCNIKFMHYGAGEATARN